MSTLVRYARQGRTGAITVDHPPVAALGQISDSASAIHTSRFAASSDAAA